VVGLSITRAAVKISRPCGNRLVEIYHKFLSLTREIKSPCHRGNCQNGLLLLAFSISNCIRVDSGRKEKTILSIDMEHVQSFQVSNYSCVSINLDSSPGEFKGKQCRFYRWFEHCFWPKETSLSKEPTLSNYSQDGIQALSTPQIL